MTTDFIRDMDTPLLKLNSKDVFTLRSAYEGSVCTRWNGSGKHRARSRAIAGALLRSGAGGLILVAKPGRNRAVAILCEAARQDRRPCVVQ